MDRHSGKVSVVIPTYNRADVLGSAIDSALAQTYDDLEIIVVDDGSTDETPQVIEQFGEEVRYHRFDENRGANAARNAGIELATGEFIAFLDADDRWKPEKITLQVAAFQQADPGCALVHTGIERRDTSGEKMDQRVPPEPDDPQRRLLLGNFVGTFSCILVRSEAFDVVGTLDESLPSWQDWEFYLRVADEFEFTLVPEVLTIKRAGRDDQISRNIDPLLNETYPMFRSIINGRTESYGLVFRRRALAMLNMEVGDAALMNDRGSVAKVFFFRGLQLYPAHPKLIAYFILSLCGPQLYGLVLKAKRRIRVLEL